MTINERIFKTLEDKKLKQSDLANHIGVSTGQITAWKKRGTTPPAEYLINICKFLHITIYELLGEDQETKSELEYLYSKASPDDKATIDFILAKYKEQKSSISMIGWKGESNLIEYGIYIATLLLAIAALIKIFERQKKENKEKYNYSYDKEKLTTELPYKARHLVTPTESIFFKMLKERCDENKLLICPKVRLEDIAEVTTKQNNMKYRGYIKSRHVDFLICKEDLSIIAGVELDDYSHNSSSAQKIDEFKDSLFRTIKIPLFRIKVGNNYDEQLNHLFFYILPNNRNVNNDIADNTLKELELIKKQNEILKEQNEILKQKIL